MWEVFGFIASFCFIVCGLPQVFLCIKQGHANGLSKSFLWIWLIGEFSLIIYSSLVLTFNIPLLLNAFFCALVCLIILKYMYFPIKKKYFVIKNFYFLKGFRHDH